MQVERKIKSASERIGGVPVGSVLSVDPRGGVFMRVADGSVGGSSVRVVVLGPSTERTDVGQIHTWSADTPVYVHATATVIVEQAASL